MGFNFRAAAEAMAPEPVEQPDVPGLDQPPSCSYCGGVEFEGLEDHGRGVRSRCASCGGTMTSDGMGYWQPELIGSPKNHPKPNPDPASGGVPGVWAPVLRREDLSDRRMAANWNPGNLPDDHEWVQQRPEQYRWHGKYRLFHKPSGMDATTVTAHAPHGDGYRRVGYLGWHDGEFDPARHSNREPDPGVIHSAFVSEKHRRKGLASAMLDFAREVAPEANVRHSNLLTEDAQGWASKKAGVDWCRHRHAEHCWLPKNDTAGAMALYVPQDRGACPWTTASMQQINCPVSEPGPMAGMAHAGAAEAPPTVRGMGPTHDQASCPVCTQTEPGRVVHTAAPVPAPHANPMEGGHSWYHGTNYDPEEDYKYQSEHRQFTHPQQTLNPGGKGFQVGPQDTKRSFTGDPGGRLQPPDRRWTGKFGGNSHYHWNTDLGVHYTSHKETADEFAHSGISSYDDSARNARTAHTHLHMQNPIHFANEKELGAHAINWARENGHKFLPEHPQAHEHFINGEDEEVSKYSPHVEYDQVTHNHIPERDDVRRAHISRLDNEGVQHPQSESLDHIDSYLANHPDREDMMGKYRDHLKSKGHDGIVYGNSYEGPFEHPCAIAFPDTVQHIHKWEWHHPGEQHRNPKIDQPEYDPGQHALFPHGTSPMDWERSPHFKAGAQEFGSRTHLSWNEIGERHPHIYGDEDVHGEVAEGADGWAIGDAVNCLAHERQGDGDAQDHMVHDLNFHEAHVDPKHIDYAPSRGTRSEGRMWEAHRGFSEGQGHKIPPVVLVHRHGVYQVADGHHRAEGAHLAGTTLRAYVAHSPYPDEPDRDGGKAPYHGRAVPIDAPDPHRKESSVDPELRMHMTATWADVRNKAKRIRAEGGVNLLAASFDGLAGNVQGDTAIYETSLNYLPGTYKVAYWTCGCAWASYAWGRSAPYRRFEGRMCSHALAMQFEAQSRGMFGKTVEPDSDRPSWLRAHSPVQTHYDRDSGTGRTRRAVPPGNMRTRFEGARALDPEGVYQPDHGLLLDRPPVYAFAVVALSQGEAPSAVAAGLEGAGLDRTASLALLGAALEDPLSAVAALPGPKQTTRCPDCGQEVSSTAQKCPHCGADLSTADPADVHVASRHQGGYDPYGEWDGEDDDHEKTTEWDDIHSGIHSLHRGVGVMLHPHDHAIVHDPTLPVHERAHHLLSVMNRHANEPGIGTHWTTDHRVAEDFSDDSVLRHQVSQSKARHMERGDHRWGTDPDGDPKGQPGTAVMFHAHAPERHEIDDTPDEMAHGSSSIYGYHDHGEREVPIRPGGNLTLSGISWKTKHDDLDEPEDHEDSYTHHEFADGGRHVTAKKPGDDGPTHAGLVLKAGDTGRILMLQRSLEDEKDPARGTWEFPGGGIEAGDHSSFHGAMREFAEEIGQPVPAGGTLQHVWRSGPYQGHVLVIPSENQIKLADGRIVPNPDDPKGDHPEQAAWYDPEHAQKHPALRPECKSAPWKTIKAASRGKTAGDSNFLPGHPMMDPNNPEHVAEMKRQVAEDKANGIDHDDLSSSPTITRGFIAHAHHTDGWRPDTVARITQGRAGAHELLHHIDTANVGDFWHGHHRSLEDAKDYAWHDDSDHPANLSSDAGPGEHMYGGVGMVLEAHRPKGWDPNKNPDDGMMGNSYLAHPTDLALHKIHYTDHKGNWHHVDATGHTVHATGYASDDDRHLMPHYDGRADHRRQATFATGDPLGDFAQDPPAQRPDPKPGDQENPGSTGFATAADPPAFDAADSRTMRMPEMSSWGALNRLWAQAANYRQGPHRANDDLHDPESGAHFPAGSEVHVRGHYTDEDGTTWAEVKHRGRDSAFVPADQLTHREDFSTPETGPKGDPAVHQKIRDDHAREQHHERFLDKTIGPAYHPNEFGGHGRAPWGGMPHTHDTSVPSGETPHEQPRYPHAVPADSGSWVDHFDPQNPTHHIDHLYGAPKTPDGLPIQSLNSLDSGRMSIGDAARAYLRTGELHDPEQGALPVTTAEDEDGWSTDVDPAHQHVDVADTLARPDPREEMRSSIDPTEEGAMQPNQVHASTGSVDDIVARFQASAAGRALASDQGSPAAAGPTDAQIAQAARAHVAKTALKDFSPAEQRELIEEGRGGERARNFGDLKIEGTHYEALGKALDHHEQITDVDALFI